MSTWDRSPRRSTAPTSSSPGSAVPASASRSSPDHATALSLLGVSPHLRSGAVLEPYRNDLFDLNISCRTYPEFATSLIERPLRPGDGIYSFTEKYIQTSGLSNAPREMPAQISDTLAAQIAELAESVASLTGLRGVLRIDFLSDGEQVFVNEVNSIPGAMALYLWPDVPAEKILLDAIAEAQRYFGTSATTSFDEGAALRAAGGISGKAGIPESAVIAGSMVRC
ncbi:hypothetical protein [Aeromicrobium sp. UC242_57]|uniref:hypothetical protein n=1 Tax=Aeromicrobium sp. UC242_57 TaxID=3374624 RepID=UPI0037BE1440